jgi:16S rRNA processing protein RimM
MRQQFIHIGKITAAHGIKGFVKCQSYTDIPAHFADYSPLTDKTGVRCFEIIACQPTSGKDIFLVSFQGITTRTQAEQLAGLDLFIPSDRLSEPKENEFYYADLLEREVYLPNNEKYGTVSQIYDFGAGTVLEIKKTDGSDILIPFRENFFPKTDRKDNKLIINPFDYFDAKQTKNLQKREKTTTEKQQEES